MHLLQEHRVLMVLSQNILLGNVYMSHMMMSGSDEDFSDCESGEEMDGKHPSVHRSHVPHIPLVSIAPMCPTCP